MDLIWLFYMFLLLPVIIFFLFYRSVTIRQFNVPVSAHTSVPVTVVYTLDSVFRQDVILRVRMVAPNGTLEDFAEKVESSVLNVLDPGTIVRFSTTLTAQEVNGSGIRTITVEVRTRDFVQNYASSLVVVTV